MIPSRTYTPVEMSTGWTSTGRFPTEGEALRLQVVTPEQMETTYRGIAAKRAWLLRAGHLFGCAHDQAIGAGKDCPCLGVPR